MSRSNNPYLRRMRDQRVERTITQRWEYAVKIECPWCGGLAGRVRQPVDGEREDLLQSGTWEEECVTERWLVDEAKVGSLHMPLSELIDVVTRPEIQALAPRRTGSNSNYPKKRTRTVPATEDK